MKNFKDKVAVITGAASGIGLALAKQCVLENMKVVLADIEEDALAQAERELSDMGSSVLSVKTDVSKVEYISNLADKTLERFGQVDMLFNNAGIACAANNIWESTEQDWQWTINVNLMGVVNGLRTFVPIMLKQDTEAYIVNTASVAGMIAYYFNAPYHVSKHAVVGLSEQLYFSLALQNSKIKTSVLCPGYVRTNIITAERNRPETLQNNSKAQETRPNAELIEQRRLALEHGTPPEELAKYTFDAIREERFYILSHPELDAIVNQRCEDILHRQNPDVMKTLALVPKPVEK